MKPYPTAAMRAHKGEHAGRNGFKGETECFDKETWKSTYRYPHFARYSVSKVVQSVAFTSSPRNLESYNQVSLSFRPLRLMQLYQRSYFARYYIT